MTAALPDPRKSGARAMLIGFELPSAKGRTT
jgi:hypothetical protein